MIGRAAAIYTDAFIMLSGLLTTYSIIGRLQKNQSPRIVQEYFSRFLRIVPMLAALVLFCTFVLPELGSGPQWNLVVNRHAEICKENWWRNFLFIHNYFGFGEMVSTLWTKQEFHFHLIDYNFSFAVSHSHTSSGHRYATIYIFASSDYCPVEMAKSECNELIIYCSI